VRIALNAPGEREGRSIQPDPPSCSGTGLVLLPTLTSKPDTGDEASFISEDGTIVAGQNTDRHGVIRAVEWRCH